MEKVLTPEEVAQWYNDTRGGPNPLVDKYCGTNWDPKTIQLATLFEPENNIRVEHSNNFATYISKWQDKFAWLPTKINGEIKWLCDYQQREFTFAWRSMGGMDGTQTVERVLVINHP